MNGPYKNGALVPPSLWLDKEAPAMPSSGSMEIVAGDSKISWTHNNEADVFRWAVYYKYDNGTWNYQLLNRNERMLIVPSHITPGKEKSKANLSKVLISAVDRMGNESEKRNVSW